MKASVNAILIVVSLCGVLKTCLAEGWTNTFSVPQSQISPRASYSESCDLPGVNITVDLHHAVNRFAVDLYKVIAARAKDHCVFAPLSLWLSLAAIGEGTEGSTQQDIFRVLNLPEDVCLRQKYYEMAVRHELSGSGVIMHSSRVFVADESLILNPQWNTLVRSYSLILPISMPLKHDPATAVDTMRKLISARIPKVNFNGSSVLLSSFDYQGMWATAFSDAIVEDAPFYDDYGQQIGTVELMRMKKRVSIAYLPEQELKVVILPVGSDERYCIMLGLSVGNSRNTIESFTHDVITDILKQMRVSPVPIEVAIPRFSIRTELNLRNILEVMGIKNLWSDPFVTRNISTPAALPSSFIHRATISITNAGVEPYNEDQYEAVGHAAVIDKGDAVLDPVYGKDFIANRPFMFGLYDTEAYNCLFGTMVSHPPSSHVTIE